MEKKKKEKDYTFPRVPDRAGTALPRTEILLKKAVPRGEPGLYNALQLFDEYIQVFDEVHLAHTPITVHSLHSAFALVPAG